VNQIETNHNRVSRLLAPLLLILLCVGIVFAFSWQLEREAAKSRHQQERITSLNRLSAISARLEGALLRDMALSKALAVELSTHPDITSESYGRFVDALLSGTTAITHLSAAKDMQIISVYPLAGNEITLGMDYRNIPKQLSSIENALKASAPVLTGPVTLVQGGGERFIIRMPIPGALPQEGRFLSSVIDHQILYAQAGLDRADQPLDVAIHALGEDMSNALFYGNPDILDQAPVQTQVHLPAGLWQLAAIPKGGWQQSGMKMADLIPLPLLTFTAGLMILYVRDRRLTEKALARRALQQSAQRFRRLFENASDGILILDDANGKILDANPKASDILKSPLSALQNRSFEDFLDPSREALHDLEPMRLEATDGDPESRMVIGLLPADGHAITGEISTGWMEQDEKSLRIVHLRDISGRMHYEAELRQARMIAETANELKSRFLANFSHEIRTPLNAIVGFSEIIRRGLFGEIKPARYAGYIDDIHHSGEHLLVVINDILDLSRIEAGEMPITPDWVAIHGLFEECNSITIQLARDKGIVLSIMPPDVPLSLYADRARLRQILLNLIGNAIKFTLPGGSVFVYCEERSDGAYALCVKDNGIGMSPDHLADALRPFGQIPSKKSVDQSGSGLGLTLSKALCDLQSISLDIKSKPNEGTRISLTIPARLMRLD
jgi:PAS domain S-box-containing protein